MQKSALSRRNGRVDYSDIGEKRQVKQRSRRARIGMAFLMFGLFVPACTQPLGLPWAGRIMPTQDGTQVRMTADALVEEARLLLVTPNPFAAIDLLYEAIALQPDAAENYFYMGEANFYLRNYEQAVEWLNSAIALDPGFVSAYRMRGDAAMFLEDYDLAQESYEQLLELGYCDTWMISNLNQIYQMQGEQQDAAQHESCQAAGIGT